MHYTLHSCALASALLGLWAAFQSHNLKLPVPIPNLYTSHSYLGMTTMALLLAQFCIGFCSYLYPKASLSDRLALGPVHRFLGIATWVTGLATCAVSTATRWHGRMFAQGLHRCLRHGRS